MTKRNLHQLMADVHTELLATQSADSATRDRLQHLADDIRATIERTSKSPAAEEYQGLRDRLAEVAVGFEVSHPKLTTTLENLIDTLGEHTL
jgi:uncharacterized heparinase superfamily protein